MKKNKEKKANNMTRKELEAVRVKAWDEDIKFHSFVLLPTKRLHDSGYGIFSAVLIDEDDNPICRTSSCHDVVHLNGIGGLNFCRRNETKSCSWSIDLLPTSKLFRLWDSSAGGLTSGLDLSSLEVFSLGG